MRSLIFCSSQLTPFSPLWVQYPRSHTTPEPLACFCPCQASREAGEGVVVSTVARLESVKYIVGGRWGVYLCCVGGGFAVASGCQRVCVVDGVCAQGSPNLTAIV